MRQNFFKGFLTLFSLSFILTAVPQSHASEVVDRIVAVVGENIITAQDLQDRLRFATRNINTALSPAQKAELIQAQLSELIEEEILLQYAKEKGYQVSQAQMDQTIRNLEKQNKQPEGSFLKFAGAEKNSALRSIKTTILTQLIRDQELALQANIGTQEVEQIVQSIISRKDDVSEKELAQIFIPVTEAKEEAKTKTTIERLHSQLLDGQNFQTLAQAYSRDGAAGGNGALGWFRSEELVPEIEAAVEGLKKGEISKPVRSANGWHIFKILDTRTPPAPNFADVKEYKLLQLYAPVDSTAGTPAALQNKKHQTTFNAFKENKLNETAFRDLIKQQKESSPLYLASGDMGWVNAENQPSEIKKALSNAEKGQVVGPISTEEGTHLFFVENIRNTSAPALQALRTRVHRSLISRQTDLAFRRLMRDLKRRTYIDVRL